MTFRRWATPVVALLAGISVFNGSMSPAGAQSPVVGETLSVTLLGDSYSAGNGAGNYEPGAEGNSYRSTINWARNYVSWLNDQGIYTNFNNVAHSGHTTHDVLNTQLNTVPEHTDVAMLTIGGNDVNFDAIVTQCFLAGARDPESCETAVEQAEENLPEVMNRTEQIFQNLDAKLASDAEIILVGYPLLASDREYELAYCHGLDAFCEDPFDAGTAVRNLGNKATELQQAMVADWNSGSNIKATYVDSIETAFAGHEPDPSAWNRNDHRWINEFFETAGRLGDDGKTKSDGSLDSANFYHPNVIGHEQIAVEISNKVGVPEARQPLTETSGDIDIVFTLDTTGSMYSAIDNVKENIREIVAEVHAQSSSARFALVTYRDHPVSGGDLDDYPAQVEVDFTTDIDHFQNTLNGVTVDGGGDWPESIYSGIMAGLDLGWRPGVKKTMVVLGDAPSKDPEPVTGYTWASVAQRAFDIDPVEVYAVDTGDMVNAQFQQLIDDSLGKAYHAGDYGWDVSEVITEALTTALDKPFGWLQGPISGYVGESVKLDARGSYSKLGPLTLFEWDFNGDGIYEASTPTGLIEQTFTETFTGTAGVRVTAPDGSTALGSAPITIQIRPDVAAVPEPGPDKEGVYELVDGEEPPFPVRNGEDPTPPLDEDPVTRGGLSSGSSGEFGPLFKLTALLGSVGGLLAFLFGPTLNSMLR